MSSLDGRIAILTGAGSGIGAALAGLMSERGARLALVGRRANKLAETAKLCPEPTICLPADVTSAEDRAMIVDRTRRAFGGLDILVNNAGLGGYGSFTDLTETEWRMIFEVNVFAPAFLIGLVLPNFLEKNSGLILNVGSIASLIAHSDKVSAYAASKHALLGMARGLARDLEGTGVRVVTACPHLTDTEFFDAGPDDRGLAETAAKYRKFMDSPKDVARGILEQLDSANQVIFPTDKPRKAYEKSREAGL